MNHPYEPIDNPYAAFGDEDGYIDSFSEEGVERVSAPAPPGEGAPSSDDRIWWGHVVYDRIRRAAPARHPAIYAEHFVRLALSKP